MSRLNLLTSIHKNINELFVSNYSQNLKFDQNVLFSLRSTSDCSCNYFDFNNEHACTSNAVSTKPRCGCREWINGQNSFCYTKLNCGTNSSFAIGAQFIECNTETSTPPPPPAVPLTLSCQDPAYVEQWHHSYINLVDAWTSSASDGVNISIVVVDTGIEETHPDLQMDENDRYEWNTTETLHSHGTNCAGIIASVRNNMQGGCGIAFKSKLIDAQLLNADLTDIEFESRLLKIYPKFENRSDILFSNSWGPAEYSSSVLSSNVKAMFDDFVNKRNGLGTLLIWAAGNGYVWDNINDDPYNSHVATITVTSSSEMLYRSYYSEYGSCIDVTAPSNGGFGLKGIYTTTTNSGYTVSFGGTSAAAPTVSGIVSMMISKNPNLSIHDVRQLLWKSCTVIDRISGLWIKNAAGHEYSHLYGYGLIDANSVMNKLENYNLLAETYAFYKIENEIQSVHETISTTWYTVSDSCLTDLVIESVELFLNITHDWKGDFDISLVSPSGTVAPISYYIPKQFYVQNGLPSVFVPHSYLVQAFFEESSLGTWQVNIKSGEINSILPTFHDFKITFHGHVALQEASIVQDPHISFANGDKTDVRGVSGHFYNIFTRTASFINVKFEESLFRLHTNVVNGTFISQFYYSTNSGFVIVNPLIHNGWKRVKVSCGLKPHHLFYSRKIDCINFKVNRDYSSIKIKDEDTDIIVRMMPVYNRITGPQRRLDIVIKYRGHQKTHGLLGQSFHNKLFHCKNKSKDVYSNSNSYIVTKNQADGCIEETIESYEVSSLDDHGFKFSLYNLF